MGKVVIPLFMVVGQILMTDLRVDIRPTPMKVNELVLALHGLKIKGIGHSKLPASLEDFYMP